MKLKFPLFPLCAAVLLAAGAARAQTGTNWLAQELDPLIKSINVKLEKGQHTEAQLAEELKGFDLLLAKHAKGTNDEAGVILLNKADLYLQVLGNPARAQETYKQLAQDYSGSKYREMACRMIDALEPVVAAQKIRDSLKPGTPLPDFNEPDSNGKALSISQFKGKVVLLDFWATWCVPCVMEIPGIVAAYDKHHQDGLEVIGVSFDDDLKQLRSFTAKKGMTWPQFFDADMAKRFAESGDPQVHFENRLGRKYGVDKLPTTILVDRAGNIIATDLRGEALSAAVEKALAKK